MLKSNDIFQENESTKNVFVIRGVNYESGTLYGQVRKSYFNPYKESKNRRAKWIGLYVFIL